jgi:O-antigen biosynthesis protein WbqP
MAPPGKAAAQRQRRRCSEVEVRVNTAQQQRALRRPDLGKKSAKRALDVALAAPMLLFSLPLWAAIALAIRLDSPGPVIFRQRRVGRNGELFTIWKFRTMRTGTPDLPTDEMAATRASPVTAVGAALRRLSLDELPQLVNVLRGEMSLVGPRPALPTQAELNAKRAAAGVDRLLPGITGWAQIHGRDALDTDAKLAQDVVYLQRQSVWLDLWILVRTLAPVVSGRGNR